MDWQDFREKIVAKYEDVKKLGNLELPALPCSLANIQSHDIETEKELRPIVDKAVALHWSTGTVPASKDVASLVSDRYFNAILAIGLLADESSPNCAAYGSEEEIAKWLLIESWSGFGVAVWTMRTLDRFECIAKGWGLAEQNFFKLPAANVPELSKIVLTVCNPVVRTSGTGTGAAGTSVTL